MSFHRTQLLLEQAISYQAAGQWESALRVCETLFDSSWRAGQIDDAQEALLRMGWFYLGRHSKELATEYFDLVFEISAARGDKGRMARAINGLGIIRQRGGDIDGAEEHYRRAVECAGEKGHHDIRGDLATNLGNIAIFRGDLENALAQFHLALNQYEQIGDQKRSAQVLNNLGIVYKDRECFADAHETFARAISISRLCGDVQVEGIAIANRTELYLSEQRLDDARLSCDEAFEIASRLNNGQLKADALKSYGVIYREGGRPHLAESHLRQGISLAKDIGDHLIEADAYRELALVLRSQERNRESLEALNAAHSLYQTLQRRRHQAEIDERVAQLEADFLRLVEMWGESIEAKDEYTRGHCQRVADYACKLAEISGIPDREMSWFRMGAFLHDVGKTEVPEDILNKPGRLTDEERFIIEQHTVAGDEMLAQTEFPYPIRPMVRSHHERWDGNGYPDKLSAEEIPFTARILHVVDVFDALTSTRSYRKALTSEEALEIMENDLGSFDPELLIAFKHLLDEGAYTEVIQAVG